jgi:hypothetical protein
LALLRLSAALAIALCGSNNSWRPPAIDLR